MKRSLWDRFMIALMGAVIVFCVLEMWRSPAPLNESRCMFSIGLAVVVIALKVSALRKAGAGGREGSRVEGPESRL